MLRLRLRVLQKFAVQILCGRLMLEPSAEGMTMSSNTKWLNAGWMQPDAVSMQCNAPCQT